MRYYLWHENQVKMPDTWSEVLSYRNGYVLTNTPSSHSFGYVIVSGQCISVSPGEIPKAFKLGLMLLDIRI